MVKTGRTHLMDAMPVTFAQELSGWRVQVENGRARVLAGESRLLALAQGGTAVGTGINAHPEFGARFCAALATLTGLPFAPSPQLFRGAVRAGLRRRALGPAQGGGGQPDEDRQRSALDELRPARRARGDRAARAAARLVDHAGQGQPGDPGGGGDGCGAGDRQRRHDHRRRPVGQFPVERDVAGDRLEPAREPAAARQRVPGCWPTAQSPDSRSIARGSPRRWSAIPILVTALEPGDRLRTGRRDRQAGLCGGPADPRGRCADDRPAPRSSSPSCSIRCS